VRNHLPGYSVFTTEELVERYLQQLLGNYRDMRENDSETFTPGILLNKHGAGYLLDSILKNTALDALQEIVPAGSSYEPSGYLNIETFRQGYVRALCEYIYDFRKTHHEDLLSVLELFKKGKLSAKEKDLVDIHDEYEKLLDQRGLYDYCRGVATFVQDREQHQAQDIPESTLVIAGFSRVTSLDRRLLLGLVSRFQQSVVLYCSNPKASAAVFRVQDSFQSFLQELRSSSANLQEDRKNNFLPLAELIFHDDRKNRLFKASTVVKLFQAENRYSEVTSIARCI
ncbi:unnamed protein product, partial [marine sediment metagenome]